VHFVIRKILAFNRSKNIKNFTVLANGICVHNTAEIVLPHNIDIV